MRHARAVLLLACFAQRGVLAAQDAGCPLDDALSEAAANLLLADQRPDAAQLVAAVRSAGSDAVALHAQFAAAGEPAQSQKWLAEQRGRADAELVCGSAQSEHARLLISSARGGSLEPIDPHARTVRGRLAPRFDRAEIVVASADGQLVRFGASAAILKRGVVLPADLVAPLKVQLLAHGPAGPRPVAERIVEAEGTARAPAADSSSDTSQVQQTAQVSEVAPKTTHTTGVAPGASADDLTVRLSGLRRARGRGVLRDNRLLRTAASAHAQAVCREGRIVHEVTHGRGPEERLASVGLSARLLGEVIARAADADGALVAFEQSPSHLLTVLEPRFTDMGVGRATDNAGKTCFVVLFCAWPRAVMRHE